MKTPSQMLYHWMLPSPLDLAHLGAFNADSIIFDNTPWRPGRDLDIDNISREEERRLKQNLATRVLSNGVEVLVKDKNTNSRKPDQRRNKLIHLPTIKQSSNYIKSNMPKISLLSSAVATIVNNQQIKAMFPLHQLMQHNYIIKTCLTTYTYLTTVVQNKRSAISTFETIVSVITTESLTNLFASDLIPDIKPTKTKYMEVKTIQPSEPSQIAFQSSIFPKINKRVDNEDEEFDFIQPSEVNHAPCTTSCPCSQSKTEYIDRYKTKFINQNDATLSSQIKSVPLKTSYEENKFGNKVNPTKKETFDKATGYRPYEYETDTNVTPIDKVVEKYTEIISDYSDEKDPVKESELLTNEQAPTNNNNVNKKQPQKNKTDKLNKHNKNKFVVADLLKLGSLGIKGLSQLAPVIEKMTGTFMKRQDVNNKTVSTSTIRPQEITNTPYNANKRIDNDVDFKHSNFPIYIPVDELEVSETQYSYKNATLHQNLAWANDHKHPKAHNIIPPKIIHESALVNGGIPISPGEIITTNSDVIVGKPAVGGPLTLTSSGLKLQNTVIPPQDSYISSSEQFIIKEKPPTTKLPSSSINIDDSYDLRPPDLPKNNQKPLNKNITRPFIPTQKNNNKIRIMPPFIQNIMQNGLFKPNEQMMKTEKVRATNIMSNHGTPLFLDYIPSLGTKPNSNQNNNIHKYKVLTNEEYIDSSPSSSEIVNTQFNHNDGFSFPSLPNDSASKPFLVDIQPSRVANVLIPHGSSTALVFAGSSEPHKTGDYIDDPLPYPEPGYFGSFSIDAPQMTNVHNVASNTPKPNIAQPSKSHFQHNTVQKDQVIKQKWRENRRPNSETHNLPPPTSNQETHFQVGPHITSYNPDIYNPSNDDFDDLRIINENKNTREVIDKEYENYLAVPPPPPKRNNYDNRRPYHQRPIVHTKPIQDMKVFLNIQHPVSKPNTQIMEEQLPPKVTSEIYFAAQSPESNKQIYTINLQNNKPIKSNNVPEHFGAVKENDNTIYQKNNNYNKSNNNIYHIEQSFSKVDNPIKDAGYSNNNIYTVTLNTATNVANGLSESGHVVGSSIPVAVGTPTYNFAPINTDIPIGTNFAIKVDDNSSTAEDYNLEKGQKLKGTIRFEETDNRWNISTIDNKNNFIQGINKGKILDQNVETSNKIPKRPEVTYLNSHANFPMVNEPTTISNIDFNIKPVTEEDQDKLDQNNSQPSRLIPSTLTNSHGWFSNYPIKDLNLSSIGNINNIKVESSTRNIIPLSHDYTTYKSPNFGHKITSVGKPPTEFWNKSKQNIGKPFTKPKTESSKYLTTHFTTKPLGSNYIPSNIGFVNQPVYDIPIKDNYDETTTFSNIESTSAVKPMFENSYEIYDDVDEDINNKNESGEISQESMSVPFVSASPINKNTSKLTTKITLLQEEVFDINSHNKGKKENTNNKNELVKFNPGTQTEKPFATEGNVVQSNSIKSVTETNKYYNMKPRPFTINSGLVLDNQLHQPHWQINQLWVNQTNLSSDEHLDLNYGERVTTMPPPATKKVINHSNKLNIHYNKPPRTVFSVRPNITYSYNDSNIITSTFHIKDKKPITILDDTDNSSTMSTFTIPLLYSDNASSEIVDLSPPPPTIDYNFKPTNNDETIMGMSPPPPQTPVIRPATRNPLGSRPALSSPYRTKPPRTIPPRVPIYRPTRKPTNEKHRDEISTYRPSYDVLTTNIRRPVINANQPSSQLLPPPEEASLKVPIADSSVSLAFDKNVPSIPNIIFPTPTSSGWLTSSGIGFSSSFDFAPTAMQFPIDKESSYYIPTQTENSKKYSEPSSEKPQYIDSITTNKYINSINDHHIDDSGITNNYKDLTSTTSKYEKNITLLNENVTEKLNPATNVEKDNTTESLDKSSESSSDIENYESQIQKDSITTNKPKINVYRNRDRTRKPFPIRETDKKTIVNRFKPSMSPSIIIKPTKTLTNSDIVHSTKLINTRRIIPVPGKGPIIRPSIIESSESLVEEDYIKPTEVLTQSKVQTIIPDKLSESVIDSKKSLIPSISDNEPLVIPTHHAGNEVKVYDDDIIPTKTEFKTTVITLTKTLLEPPKTVSSIDYVNITHTLTVTQTKTSLISQSAGAVTQTLVLTNTHTSTIVDVITKVQTEVQPTTIIETVTKHIPIPQVDPTPVLEAPTKTVINLDDVSISSEEENLIIHDSQTTENVQKIEKDEDNDTFFVVMNKSQNGGSTHPVATDIETDYDGITRNEQVNNNGVSQVLFGEILLAGTPYLETTNIGNPSSGFSKECQPDCKASRNERCQRIDGLMKCVCRPGFARMFPDRPCKPTYTYSVKLALSSKGKENLKYKDTLANNATTEYNALALAAHEGINRMVMQSDLRDVYHGVHITGFHPVEMKNETGDKYQGVVNDFYVQLSDNAHESRLKEVIEKYLRNNNYSLGGTDVFASSELINNLEVSDFDECTSVQFHDCSEHAQCFNLRGTYTCSCLEGFADLSVNNLYPGRICSAEPVGCELCNYHGACYSRDDRRVLCECFQWYAGSTCQINLKVVLISLVTVGAFLTVVLIICAIIACSKRPRSPPQRSIVACIQGMPGLPQGAVAKQRADRRALISERAESGDASSVQNASLPYMPTSKKSSSTGIIKKCMISDPPTHEPPPPPAPAVMIPRARLHPPHRDSRENLSRKQSLEVSEAKLISYLEAGASSNDEMMRRKHSVLSSYSAHRERHSKQGALVSAGFKVSTTIRVEDSMMKEMPDDLSSITKQDLETELDRYNSMRKSYSHEELSQWTDAERRIGELTLSEARSVGGTLPASTGRAASSTRLTHQEANTMAERDLGSTFLLPHVHLYKPDITSDVSEFDSL